MRDEGRPRLEKEPEVRIPFELLQEPGVTGAHIRCYAAIRARAGFEPAADNFLRSWPSVATIAQDASMNRATVIRSVEWLEGRDFLLVERRPNRSSEYTILCWRGWYRDLVRRFGRAEAWELLRERMNELDQESRSGQAEAAMQNPRQKRATGRKSHGRDRLVVSDRRGRTEATDQSQGGDPGSRSGATPVVASVRPRTEIKELGLSNCVKKNRGAATAAPVHVSHTSKNNNDLPVDERQHLRSLLRRGVAAVAAKQGEDERTFEEKLAEARRKARLIVEEEGMR